MAGMRDLVEVTSPGFREGVCAATSHRRWISEKISWRL
jgi:hypothetical protein